MDGRNGGAAHRSEAFVNSCVLSFIKKKSKQEFQPKTVAS
jgi:hypothetical protein